MNKLVKVADGVSAFYCLGCETHHSVWHSPAPNNGPLWGYNNNPSAPTFTPSIMVRGESFTKKGREEYSAWVETGSPKPAPEFERAPSVCHSFVTDGRIQYLSDCTHHLAGQTIELPVVDDAEQEDDQERLQNTSQGEEA